MSDPTTGLGPEDVRVTAEGDDLVIRVRQHDAQAVADVINDHTPATVTPTVVDTPEGPAVVVPGLGAAANDPETVAGLTTLVTGTPEAPAAAPQAAQDATTAAGAPSGPTAPSVGFTDLPGPSEAIVTPTAPEPASAAAPPEPGPASAVGAAAEVASQVEVPAPPPTETIEVGRLAVGSHVRRVEPGVDGGDEVTRYGMVVNVTLTNPPAYTIGWFDVDRPYARDELEAAVPEAY